MYCYKANKQWTNYGKVPLPPGINSTLLFNLWSHRSVSGNPFQRVPQPSAWQKSGSVSFCGSSEPELNVFSSPLPANTPTELHSLPRSQCHSSVTGGWKQSCCLWYHVPTQGKVPAPVPQEEPTWRITSLEGPCSSSSETQLPELHSKLHLCSMFSRRIIALKLDPVKSFSLTLTCRVQWKQRVLCFCRPVGTVHMCHFFCVLLKKFNSTKNSGQWPLNFLLWMKVQ